MSAIGPKTMASGKEFTDRLCGLRKRAATGRHEFDQLCNDFGIEHRLSPPVHPQSEADQKTVRGTVSPPNGMVERIKGRIEEPLQSHHFRSGEALETTLHRYVLLYNQQSPWPAGGQINRSAHYLGAAARVDQAFQSLTQPVRKGNLNKETAIES